MNDRTSPVIAALNEAVYTRGLTEQEQLTDDVLATTWQLSRDDLLDVLVYFVGRAHTSLWAHRQREERGEA